MLTPEIAKAKSMSPSLLKSPSAATTFETLVKGILSPSGIVEAPIPVQHSPATMAGLLVDDRGGVDVQDVHPAGGD